MEAMAKAFSGKLMNRIKRVLVDKHIGAIVIALLLSRAISYVFAAITFPLNSLILAKTWPAAGRTPSTYEVIMSIAGAIFDGVLAGLLLKWLYFPSQPKMIDGAEDRDGQEADAQ